MKKKTTFVSIFALALGCASLWAFHGSLASAQGASRAIASDSNVLLNIKDEAGNPVQIVGGAPVQDGKEMKITDVAAVINGKTYRIADHDDSALLTALCKPYADRFSHIYNTAGRKGFFQKVVSIDDNLVAHPSSESVVITNAFCMQDEY